MLDYRDEKLLSTIKEIKNALKIYPLLIQGNFTAPFDKHIDFCEKELSINIENRIDKEKYNHKNIHEIGLYIIKEFGLKSEDGKWEYYVKEDIVGEKIILELKK